MRRSTSGFSRPPALMVVEIERFRVATGVNDAEFERLMKAVGQLNRLFVRPEQLLNMKYGDLPNLG